MNALTALLGLGLGAGVLYVATHKDEKKEIETPPQSLPPYVPPAKDDTSFDDLIPGMPTFYKKKAALHNLVPSWTDNPICPYGQYYNTLLKKCVLQEPNAPSTGSYRTMGKQYLRPYGYRTGKRACGCASCQNGAGDCNFNKLVDYVSSTSVPAQVLRQIDSPIPYASEVYAQQPYQGSALMQSVQPQQPYYGAAELQVVKGYASRRSAKYGLMAKYRRSA